MQAAFSYCHTYYTLSHTQLIRLIYLVDQMIPVITSFILIITPISQTLCIIITVNEASAEFSLTNSPKHVFSLA